MENELKILISGILNLSTTEKTLDQQLKELSGKLDSIKLKVEFDESTLAIFKKMSDNIEKMASGAKAALKEETKVIEETIIEFQKLDGSIERVTEQTLKNGEIIKKTRIKSKEQIEKETEAINKQKKSLEDLTEENDHYNQSISDTIRRNPNGDQTGARYVHGQEGTANRLAINVDADNVPTGTVETINSLKNEQIAEKEHERLIKAAEALDRAHYMALKEDRQRFEAQDKIHYLALQKNREIDLKNQEKVLKDAEKLDRDHYMALRTDQQKEEAQQKQHSSALLENSKRDYDFQQKQTKALLQIDSMRKTYQADPKALESLDQLETKLNSISKIGYKQQFDSLGNEIKRVGIESEISGKSVLKLNEAFRIAFSRTVIWMGAMTAFYFPLRQFEDGIKQVYELDTAMTDLKKVTNESDETYRQFTLDANKTASSIGALTVDVIKSSTEWSRLGYNIKQAQALAKETLIYQNVGDIKTAEDASQTLISTIKGFGIEVDDQGKNVTKVVDLYNNIGNKFAISSAGIGEAMRRAAASLYQSGNTIEQAVALITAANTTIQDPASVGTALKTVSMRIQGISDDGEDLSNLIPTLEKQFNTLGLTLKKNDNTFKSTYEIFNDLSSVWKNLSGFQQANIVELVAGKRQGNIITSMLNNWKDATNALTEGLNSAGSAAKENAVFMDSLQGKIKQFKDAVTSFWQSSFNTEAFKTFIDMGTELITILAKVVDTFGFMPTVIFAATTALVLFNKTAREFAIGLLPNMIGGMGNLSKFFKTLAYDIKGLGIAGTFSIGILSGVRTALLGLLASTGIGLAIAGLTSALSALFSHIQEAKQAQKELDEQNKKSIQSYNDNKDSVDSLVKTYSTLSENSKINLTTDELQQLTDVQNKLNGLMPSFTNFIDQQGNAHLKNSKAIQDEIAHLEKLQTIQSNEKINTFNSDIKNSLKDANIQGVTAKINESNKTSNRSVLSSLFFPGGIGSENDAFDKKIEESEYAKSKAYENSKTILLQYSDAVLNQKGLTDSLNESDKTHLETLAAKTVEDAKGLKTQKEQADLYSKSATAISNEAEALAKARQELGEVGKAIPTDKLLNLTGEQRTKLAELDKSIGENKEKWNDQIEVLKSYGIEQDIINVLISNGSKAASGYSLDIKGLSDAFDNSEKKLKTINQAISDVSKGQSLSGETIKDLIVSYPELADKIQKTADGYTIERSALEEVRKQKVKTEIDSINSDFNITKSAFTTLQERLKNYGVEIDAIESLSDAKLEAAKVQSKIDDILSQDTGNTDEHTFLSQKYFDSLKKLGDLKNLEDEVLNVGKGKDVIKALTEQLNNPNLGVSNNKDKENQDTQASLHEITDTTNEEITAIKSVIATRDENIKSLERQIKTAEKSKDYNKTIELSNKLLSEQNEKLNDITNANNKFKSSADKVRDVNADLGKQFEENGVLFDKWFNPDSSASQTYIDAIHKIDQEMKNIEGDGKNLTKEQQNLIKEKENEKKLYQDIFSKLQSFKKAYADNLELAQQTTDEIDATKESINNVNEEVVKATADANKAWLDDTKKVSDEIVQTYKDVFDKQKQVALDAINDQIKAEEKRHKTVTDNLDAETKKLEDAVNAQQKLIDRQSLTDDYNQNLQKAQTERQKIQNEIDARKLDTSIESKSKVSQLTDDLAKKDEEIQKLQTDRTKELRKDGLTDYLDTKKKELDASKKVEDDTNTIIKESLDKQKEEEQKKWEAVINNDQTYLKIREDIISGSLTNINTQFETFKNFIQQHTEEIGKDLSNNLITKLQTASQLLSSINYNTPATNPLGMSQSDFQSYLKNKYDYENNIGNPAQSASDNASLRQKYGIPVDNYDYQSLKNAAGFDTGGLTPSFGSGGKLAFLHQKELVLDKFDTANILKSVDIARNLFANIQLPKFNFDMIRPAMAGASNNYNITMYNNVTGNEQGGKQVFKTFVSELQKFGKQV